MINYPRLYWVDTLRGLFILLMIVYHFVFDLDYLNLASFNLFGVSWALLSLFVQLGFFGLVGFSLTLSYRHSNYRSFLKRQLKRATLIFLVALAITGITSLLFPGDSIGFGALHFISLSIALGALLIPYPLFLALSLIPIVLIGLWFTKLSINNHWLIPLGLTPSSYTSFDFFPLFPWLAVVFSGILIAHWMDSQSLLRNPQKFPRIPLLELPGRHSLLIYVLHQPLLFGSLWLLQNV